MKNTLLMAIAAVLLVGGVACNRARKSGPEAALDRAYQSGILSGSEYEAKKAALLAPAAPPVSVPVAAPAPSATAMPAPDPVPAQANPPAHPPAATKPAVVAARVNRPAEPAAQPVAVPEPAIDTPAPPAACADTEVRPGKEKGKQERFYPMPPSKVRAALLKALSGLEFNIHTASDTQIEASKKRHIGVAVGHGGEKMTLLLEEATESNRRGTRVIGETKKSFVMRVGQKSWTNVVLDQTGCMLHTSGPAAGLSSY